MDPHARKSDRPAPAARSPSTADAVWAGVAAAVSLLLYCVTLAPGVVWGDSGEIITDVFRLGTIHPTGYPLYTLLGHLFTRLPMPGLSPAGQVNLLSALYGAAAVFVLFRLIRESGGNRPGAAAGALAFGSTHLFWSQCRIAEVYTLHLLLASIILWLLVRIHRRPTAGTLRLFALAVGFGFTNHLLTVLLAPAALYLVLVRAWRIFLRPRTLAAMGLLFLLPLLLYGYLFVSFRLDTGITWSGIEGMDEFWRHVTGRQYHHMMYSGTAVFLKNLRLFTHETGAQWNAMLLPAAVGAVALPLIDRHLGVALWLLLAGVLAYSLNYSISDIDVYFLPAWLALAVWTGVGFGLAGRLRRPGVRRGLEGAALAAAAIFVSVSAWFNIPDLKGRDGEADEYARHVMAQLPAGSVIFTQGDGYTFSLWYAQSVLGLGREAAIVSVRMRDTGWYIDMLRRRHPDLVIPRGMGGTAFTKFVLERNPGRRFFSSNTFTKNVDLPDGWDMRGRGWFEEVVPVEGRRERPIWIKNAFLCAEVRGARAYGSAREFAQSQGVNLVVWWSPKSPGFAGTVEWVAPDGQVVSRRALQAGRGTSTSWVSLRDVPVPRPAGRWLVRIVVDGAVESEQAFEILPEGKA